MNLPSIKTLAAITDGDTLKAKELRSILEITKRSVLEAVLDKYPVTRAWYYKCHHPMDFATAKLSIASEITGGHGVESFDTRKLGYCDYVNFGDPYITTLVKFDGRYRVTDWGSIAEKHEAK